MFFKRKKPSPAQGYKDFEDLIYELLPCIIKKIRYDDIKREVYKDGCRIDFLINSPYGQIIVDAKYKNNLTKGDLEKIVRDCDVFCSRYAFIFTINDCSIPDSVSIIALENDICIARINAIKKRSGFINVKYKLYYKEKHELCKNVEFVTPCPLDR